MGSYASSFVNDGADELVNIGTHPSKPNWITSHARVTDLAIVEVERLWQRFQQLGCNEDGVLEMEVLCRPPATTDVFAKNIILSFVGDNQLIDFRTFLNAMMWAERSSIVDKIKGTFNLLNNGNPVPKTVLYAVLRKTYPESTEQEVKELTDIIMKQVDTSGEGVITADEFHRWVTQDTPAEVIAQLMDFRIVPRELTLNVETEAPVIPADSLLEQLADKVYTRDWHLLTNKLGVLIAEVKPLEKKYPSDMRKQVLEMLKFWRSREGVMASTIKLENALQQAGMTDIALMFFH